MTIAGLRRGVNDKKVENWIKLSEASVNAVSHGIPGSVERRGFLLPPGNPQWRFSLVYGWNPMRAAAHESVVG